MVGPDLRRQAATAVLLWLGIVAQFHAQELAFRRLPPCETQRVSHPRVHRIPPVIQATALEAVEGSPSDQRFAQESSSVPAANGQSSSDRQNPTLGVLPAPQPFIYEPEFMLEEYLIQAGDELEIKFRFTPELNETVTVRPDGMISLQIVGAILAADQTPRELHWELVEAYRPALKDPKIVIHVRRFAGNHVFVGGEVTTPSRIPITGQLSVLQGIIRAGGFKDTADERRVILRRDGGYSVELNLKADIKGRVGGQDVLLRPYDVIFVPKSRIAKVNLFVNQYIEKMLPFQTSAGVFVSREIGN